MCPEKTVSSGLNETGSSPLLKTLQHIVEEVGKAESMGEALRVLVSSVCAALKVDVCSVYLVQPGSEQLLLMATEGLNPSAVGKVKLGFDEGLVGLVAQRAEAVNLEAAPSHPRFKFFPETGERGYHAFLGVPIIYQRRVLGVLVVQQRARRSFDDSDVAFLSTLAAQLAAAIRQAELSGEIQRLLRGESSTDILVEALPGAPGVALGVARVVSAQAEIESVPDRPAEDVAAEVAALEQAVEAVRSDLKRLGERMATVLPETERALFDAYALLLDSEYFIGGIKQRIREKNLWAPAALRDEVKQNMRLFEEMEDDYLRERAADIRDLGQRILAHLLLLQRQEMDYARNTVLIGRDVSASQLAEVPPECLAAVVSGRGSGSSHVAILARALGVPAVMGATNLAVGGLNGREIAIDGYNGRVVIQPSRAVRREFLRLAREERALARDLSGLAGLASQTPDGYSMPIYVNSGLLADVEPALRSGAEGVGLYRTEIPYMMRDRFPSEEEQIPIYRQILTALHPRPVTLRTLDIGGDKPLPYFPVTEDNPFLGWRGIRVMLDHPELFLTQLRAMLRASEGVENLRILFPMISTVAEIEEANRLLDRAIFELEEEKYSIAKPARGVMIEVPSAVYVVESLAKRVDYLSVGSNDLVQYLLAVDRNNSRVASLYQPFHPAVIRALMQIREGAAKAGKPVYVCGEMAGDPAAVILLLAMGYESLSVSVASLTRVKWVVRTFARKQAKSVLEAALQMEDPLQIREMLVQTLIEAGLGGLVRPGKR